MPKSQRRTSLPVNGCKFCGCSGCNPIDIRKARRVELKERIQRNVQSGGSNYRDEVKKLNRIIDSEDEDFEKNDRWLHQKNDLAK